MMEKRLLGVFFSTALFSVARLVHAVTVSPQIPSAKYSGAPGSLGIVGSFYDFGLAIGGLLAFGAIVYGSIKYTLSAGNPSGQSDAKEWITSALWGLLLLAGAALILGTLNPGAFSFGGGGLQLKLIDPSSIPYK